MSAGTPALSRAASAPERSGPRRTRRNTEVALLVLALGIGLAGWVQVDLAMVGSLPSDLGAVAGFLAGLLLVSHLAVRFLAPYADPVLLPTVALLNMLGLVMIHRLDLADVQRAVRNGQPRTTPRCRPAAGLDGPRGGPVRPGARRRARPPPAAAVHLHVHAHRSRAAPAAAGPRDRRDDQRRDSVDAGRPHVLPARRAGQDRPGPVLRRVPGGEAGLPRAGPHQGPRRRVPPRARPGSDPGGLADQPRRPRLREGPGHVAALLRPVRVDALRRHPASVLAADRHRALRAGRDVRLPRVRPRPGAGPGVARPVRVPGRAGVPGGAVPVRAGQRRHSRHRPRPGLPAAGALRRQRLHHRGVRRGAGHRRTVRDAAAVRDRRRARAAHVGGLPRPVRHAGRRRSVDRARAAGVRRHRRGHPAHPAHRPDHALPVRGADRRSSPTG